MPLAEFSLSDALIYLITRGDGIRERAIKDQAEEFASMKAKYVG